MHLYFFSDEVSLDGERQVVKDAYALAGMNVQVTALEGVRRLTFTADTLSLLSVSTLAMFLHRLTHAYTLHCGYSSSSESTGSTKPVSSTQCFFSHLYLTST